MDHNSPSRPPEPALSFTLPSLHDGIALDCRVYHPQSLAPSANAPPWLKHAAIIAHPYAPLGGSYDDPVVEVIAATLLRLGFLVGTFNFRGAHGSAGRTSWTAKAEIADYMSVVGFITHYVHFLDPFPTAPSEPVARHHEGEIMGREALPQVTQGSSGSLSPFVKVPNDIPILLLGGYSYGAMITTKLPSLESILAPFSTPACGSPAAEIRQRAQHLAASQNTVLGSARAAVIERQSGKTFRKSLGLRVGGDEDNRKSHDSRRSFSLDLEDRIHKGMAELRTKTRIGHKKRLASGGPDSPEAATNKTSFEEPQKQTPPECLAPVANPTAYRPAYLLISPLQGVVTNLATMSIPSPLSNLTRRLPTRSFSWSGNKSSPTGNKEDVATAQASPHEAELKLISHPTLAIYGDRDVFVAARKLREWASRLEAMPDSKFRAHEVSSAGHFWFQGNCWAILREAIRIFAEGVMSYDAV